MKRLFVLSILLPCGIAFGQPKTDAEVAKMFVRVFQKADTSALLGLLPTASIYRMTSPDETEGKSDSEIFVMSEPLRADIVARFRVMLREADSLGIDRSKLKLRAHETIPIVNHQGIYGMRIFFNYMKKKGEFTIGTFSLGDEWYIYAIDQDVGVFSSMEAAKK